MKKNHGPANRRTKFARAYMSSRLTAVNQPDNIIPSNTRARPTVPRTTAAKPRNGYRRFFQIFRYYNKSRGTRTTRVYRNSRTCIQACKGDGGEHDFVGDERRIHFKFQFLGYSRNNYLPFPRRAWKNTITNARNNIKFGPENSIYTAGLLKIETSRPIRYLYLENTFGDYPSRGGRPTSP